ncbi:MAG TPA: amino acid permease [Solirubrobacterales bacterium]|nr:amino acid permease [Solirubrobacterales bacterium]
MSEPRAEGDGKRVARGASGGAMLFAVAYSAVGFSLYFALGVVADYGLGLTPLLFLGAGFMFVLATLSFAEGGSMFVERGGSSNIARYAFNELVSFIAGWALLIDFIVVVALAAVSAPHYLTPIWDGFGNGSGEVLTAVAIVAGAALVNVLGWWGFRRRRLLVALAAGDIVVQVLLIVVGLAVALDPAALTQNLDLFNSPSAADAIYALVIATVAFAGIEAAADLAPDLTWDAPDLRRAVTVGAALLPIVYAGVAAVALMAVPVMLTPDGPESELGGEFIEAPILGVAQSFDPAWVSDLMQVAVVAVAPVVLVWAASTAMLGLSRHVYVLATNRQIPSWLGKLSRRRTPYVAIAAATLIAIGLVIPSDIEVLAGIYAFGATLAMVIAHASVLRLRVKKPDAARPFRVPFDVNVGGRKLPVPAIAGFVITGLAWLSVLVYHDEARWVGGGWMLFGLVGYVIYRKGFEGTSLTKRVEVPAQALEKHAVGVEYEDILVPIFGTHLDDDIVGTAGRLAAAVEKAGGRPSRLRIVFVIELPLTVPLSSPPTIEVQERANTALERAQQVAEEYDTVDVQTAALRARTVGAGIVQAAREMGAEMIVMGAEPPTKIRGGAVLGGIGGHRPDEIGPVTEYVLSRAPCRVLVTAPVGDGT